ncbi:hypothetical protein RJ639_039392 [Escallonia herrerae]|uniref:Bromo domain-containing protein n=1 Tax=Escallonia herrerae TaxID=1293975 RepID=A0AA88WLU1_9ASTE|nr:hypothetical protein RJ639_039392 [Escallonia herrerae]
MGQDQIVRRKKKGRPSKADLAARRAAVSPKNTGRDLRRSLRPRSSRYTFDFDDYLDEDEEYLFRGGDDGSGDDDEGRREKKLKLQLLLKNESTQRVQHAPPTVSPCLSDSDEEPMKKRKIDGGGAGERGIYGEEENNVKEDDDEEVRCYWISYIGRVQWPFECVSRSPQLCEAYVRGRKPEAKGADSVPGSPSDPPSAHSFPDKKTLELILDKLQKKDIYGVYAEPVDPEELPDYHEVIKHPMDFATVRNKLASGRYSTLAQMEAISSLGCYGIDVVGLSSNLEMPSWFHLILRSVDQNWVSVAVVQRAIPVVALKPGHSDVVLICSNAMQYNAPDTVYYKQASSIQELAKRKFQKLRIVVEHSGKELKSEQKTGSNSLANKLLRKPISQAVQEPVGSDFSSGATLATAGDFQNGPIAVEAGGNERPANVNAFIEGNSSMIDNNLDKGEEPLPGKSGLSRLGRKSLFHDENRRATYSISNQPVAPSESILATFEGESKQLVPVGLHADHSYGRSLARFAATLGPVAWGVASMRIEQALPAGFKFGRGWVGEYEPLPTPILMLRKCTIDEPPFLKKLPCTAEVRKDGKVSKSAVSAEQQSSIGPTLEGRLLCSVPPLTRPTISSTAIPLPAKEEPVRVASFDGKLSFICSPRTKPTDFVRAGYQPQSSESRNIVESEKKISKQGELNSPSAGQVASDFVAERSFSNGSELPASRSVETRSRNFVQSASFKQPYINGVVAGGPINGNVITNCSDSNRMVTSPCADNVPNQMSRAATFFPHGQDEGLTDPVQLMRMLAEKAQNQHRSPNQSSVDILPVAPPVPSSGREDLSNAAAAAPARAWMSIGAGGSKAAPDSTSALKNQISADTLYNPTRERQVQVSRFRAESPLSGMNFQPDKNSIPLHPFVPQSVRMGNEAQFQNRPMVFPQLVTADLSRFQVQSPWRGFSPQMYPRQKQESLPPDLNIDFQSSGSPARQSSGVLVDSQQPDLALQL